jgi:DNA topoisomerase-1
MLAATVLADIGSAPSKTARNKNIVTAVRLVAAELGNTPAICRKSYVHPVILTRYLKSGATISVPKKTVRKTAKSYWPEEIALIQFLDQHFPERRTTRRLPDEER